MKPAVGVVLFTVLFIYSEVVAEKSGGRCPPNNSFGICTFDPNANCMDNSACQGRQICCPDGCNRVCKDPETDGSPDEPSEPQSSLMVKHCPQPSGQFGICSYDESANCLSDEECKNGQMCCSEGCNKVCKDPVTFQPLTSQEKSPTKTARRQ